MAKSKLTPLDMVAREMSEHSSLGEKDISDSIMRTLAHLRRRAADAITKDVESDEAMRFAQEYQTMSELVLFFGSQLIAFEDIDAEDTGEPPN